MSNIVRIVVTGSASWIDDARLRAALEWADAVCREKNPDAEVVLVHGGTIGAERIAGWLWNNIRKGKVEVYTPEWSRDGVKDDDAGFKRNSRMLSLPDVAVVLAFQKDRSLGTEQCVVAAVNADIPVWLWAERGGEKKRAIRVTRENLLAVFPTFGRQQQTHAVTLAFKYPAVRPEAPVAAGYDPQLGDVRCGECGEPGVHEHVPVPAPKPKRSRARKAPVAAVASA